jgi:hypothetical protein
MTTETDPAKAKAASIATLVTKRSVALVSALPVKGLSADESVGRGCGGIRQLRVGVFR